MELISKDAVVQITKKYDTTIYDAAMWCRKEIEELKTYTSLETVLDKIRAEIEGWQGDIHDNEYDADKYDFVFERIFEIIDKHREE